MRTTFVTCKVMPAANRTAVLHPADRSCPLCGGNMDKFGTHVFTEVK